MVTILIILQVIQLCCLVVLAGAMCRMREAFVLYKDAIETAECLGLGLPEDAYSEEVADEEEEEGGDAPTREYAQEPDKAPPVFPELPPALVSGRRSSKEIRGEVAMNYERNKKEVITLLRTEGMQAVIDKFGGCRTSLYRYLALYR